MSASIRTALPADIEGAAGHFEALDVPCGVFAACEAGCEEAEEAF